MYEDNKDIEEFVVEEPTEFARLELNPDEWTSIYIPVLSDRLVLMNHNDMAHKFQPKYLRDFLEKILRIGKVRRIDFVDRDIPNSATPVKAAFVHFEYWYDTTTSRNLREKLNLYGQFRQKGYMYKGKRCNFYLQDGQEQSRLGYFDIRINHKPIQETECDRNVHQLYAENLLLEKELAEHKQMLIESKNTIDNLMKQLSDNSISTLITPPTLTRQDTLVIGPPVLTRSDTKSFEPEYESNNTNTNME
jgi:hypothetical protein